MEIANQVGAVLDELAKRMSGPAENKSEGGAVFSRGNTEQKHYCKIGQEGK